VNEHRPERTREVVMATDQYTNTHVSRLRIARTRGVLSGILLLLLGAWAGVIAFIGPYFSFAYTPAPDASWHWTAARAWLEVLPGAAVFLGGLLLIISASRLTTSLGGWLGVAGGAWLIVGPPLASYLDIGLGRPDPRSSTGVQALESLFFFSATGAAIVFVASLALGRLSVRSVRDVRAAERAAADRDAVLATSTPAAPIEAGAGSPYGDTRTVEPNRRYETTPPERATDLGARPVSTTDGSADETLDRPPLHYAPPQHRP
jgi:hypothetical protein